MRVLIKKIISDRHLRISPQGKPTARFATPSSRLIPGRHWEILLASAFLGFLGFSSAQAQFTLGENVSFIPSFTNPATNPTLPDVTIIDTLPSDVTYLSCSGAPCAYTAGGAVVWDVGTVPPNTNVSVTVTVQISTCNTSTFFDEDTIYYELPQVELAAPNPVSYTVACFTNTPTSSPTHTATSTATSTPTVTNTFTPTVTPTPSSSPTETFTFTYTPTPTATSTATPSPTATNTFTLTATPTATFSPTDTFTFTYTPSSTATSTATWTPTVTDTFTLTSTPTPTYSSTETFTFTSTPTPTATATATPSPTVTSTSTLTATPTATFSPTNTFTFTSTPTNTATFTATLSPTVTSTFTITFTPTVTATPTATLNNADNFYVSQNVLIPSQGPVSIEVQYPYSGNYSLMIYNSAGEHIVTLDYNQTITGPFLKSYSWNGKNKYGDDCASGVYIIYLTEPYGVKFKRILLIKRP